MAFCGIALQPPARRDQTQHSGASTASAPSLHAQPLEKDTEAVATQGLADSVAQFTIDDATLSGVAQVNPLAEETSATRASHSADAEPASVSVITAEGPSPKEVARETWIAVVVISALLFL